MESSASRSAKKNGGEPMRKGILETTGGEFTRSTARRRVGQVGVAMSGVIHIAGHLNEQSKKASYVPVLVCCWHLLVAEVPR